VRWLLLFSGSFVLPFLWSAGHEPMAFKPSKIGKPLKDCRGVHLISRGVCKT